jgi:N-acetylglucosaminyl-diphospho-decaprenol L-rhamnosyltransferase
VAVVTVVRSPGAALDRLLDSVTAAAHRPVRVLVVDLGSTDGAPQRAAERDRVAVLALPEAIAPAAAVNRAVAVLDTEWIMIADPGVEFGDGAVDGLLAAAARHPRAGALAPSLPAPDGAVAPSAFALPTLTDLLRARPPVPAPRGEGPVGWLATSCLLLRRAAWESVDGFDARHPAPYDAVDLGARLGAAGWLSVAVPSVAVTVPPRSPTRKVDASRRYALAHLRGPARLAARILLCAPSRHP